MLMVAARRAEAVFTVSNFSKTQLERFGIVPRGKAHVLRSGIDHLDVVEPDRSILATHGLDGRPYLLAIGSLAPHTNLAMLVDAFVSANLPEIDLVVAGGGNSRVFQGAGLREAANIRYLGRVSDGELKALYGAAHAFACPSLSEGFGLTPLEAMRMGCPVATTARLRVVGRPRASIASLIRYSLSIGPSAARPSPPSPRAGAWCRCRGGGR
jgi:glycosyltransferase involved in cell wall biosynthesis